MTSAFGKLIPVNAEQTQLRINLQKSLDKLNDNDTKSVAFNEIKLMINKYNTNDDAKIFITYLSNYNQSFSSSAKEYQVLLIGYLARELQFNILDFSDKSQLAANKNITRIVNSLFNFMKENHVPIQKACSLTFLEIFDNCLNKENNEQVINSIINPIFNNISNFVVSEACSICISDLFSHFKLTGHLKLLDEVAPKLFNYFTVSLTVIC